MEGIIVVLCIFIIGIAGQIYIDTRPKSQVNQFADAIARAIRESKNEP